MNIKNNFVLISVDGLIGAGKTTVINELKNKNIEIIIEPVDEWVELLTKVTKDPIKYTFELQLKILQHYSFIKKYIEHKKPPKNQTQIIIIERSVESSLHIFSKSSVESGSLTEQQFDILKTIVDEIHIDFNYRILINTKIGTCIQRIKQRGRVCEKQIPPCYLKQLNKYQNLLYETFKPQEKFIINGEQTKQQVLQTFETIIDTILHDQKKIKKN